MMGYSLTIGQLVREPKDEDGYERVSAELVSHKYAPAYGEPTDNENQRWPSYGSWYDSMSKLGLVDLMFDPRNKGVGYIDVDEIQYPPLMMSHPGCCDIKPQHLQYLEAKMKKYKYDNQDAVAGFGAGEDGYLVRGEWLLYWMRWALENCENPVFVNT